MQYKRRSLITTLIIIFVFVTLALTVIFSGVLVRPTKNALSKKLEVPQYDILDEQYKREVEILDDYRASSYTFQEPYIIQDPYNMNPLSALVMFEVDYPRDVEVTILGDDEYSTYTYVKEASSTRMELPIIGLYPGRKNEVIMNMIYADGHSEQNTLIISTEPLPLDFQKYSLEVSKPEKMEPGITLFIACFSSSYNALVDCNGQVRGFLSNKDMAHGTSMITLKNGNMLSTGDEYKQIPYNMLSLFEYNWLGKIFKEYEIPNAVHHSIQELPNGDFLAVSNDADMFNSGTREDMVIVIDRNTGEVKKEYNFRNIIDEKREPHHHFHPDILNIANVDWMHMNAAIYDERDNAIIVSSPTQSMVISINAETSEINWILGPHEGYEGSSEYLRQYLLTPVSDSFEWQWCQHAPMILPDFDNNPDTIDILIFDNGQSKSFLKETSVPPTENYSRAVQFRVNQKTKTIEQIWEYGKERGTECYATFLGDANYLPKTGNRIIAFGGQLRDNGVATDDIVAGVVGDMVTNSRVVEVCDTGEVVFEVSAHETNHTRSAETYQVERIALYSPQSFEYTLGQSEGKRFGKSYTCSQTDEIKPPKLYIGKFNTVLYDIHREGNRLIIDGNLMYANKSYLLSRAIFVFRSKDNVYIYAANSGLNGRFFLSSDLSEMKKGVYQISLAGAVVEGNDMLKGKRIMGHFPLDYKVTIK